MKYDKNIRITGSGGGASGGGADPYIPYEDENTLRSRANIRFVDLLCEGEIEGLVDGNKSIYIDGVQLESEIGADNFNGITTSFKVGEPSGTQTALTGFSSSESEISVNTKVTNESEGIVKSITSADVDDVRVTLHIPSLFEQTDKAEIVQTSIAFEIYVQADGGGYTLVHSGTKYGKCVSSYQFKIKLSNLSQYGSAPWDIKVVRVSPDADSVKKQWDLHWASYTEIINRKLVYPDSAVVGVQLNAQEFGVQVPSRAYEVYGIKVVTPSNYDIETREYSGVWNGTFQAAAYCNNPAWVYYDILTNNRYGLGLDASLIDKWTLYTIAQYCDETVDDGFGSVEPRFTFNGVISSRADAIHVVNMVASTFRAMPIWASGYATISQDYPKDPTKLVTNANVIDGVFKYEGSSLKNRHTVVNVSWNDPNDGYRLAVECVEDSDGIERYGYRPIDVVAYGCTSRGQAYRFGKWILETEQNETQIVNYRCGLDQMDVLPGSIVSIADNHYAAKRMGGRVSAASTTEITLDNPVILEAGITYTISLIKDDGTIQEDLSIDNVSDSNEHSIIELSTPLAGADVPKIDSVWVMTATNVYPREFRVVRISELETNQFEITAVFYDPNKFARVDEGKTFDPLPYTTVPDIETALTAPTNPWVEEYSYIDGENALFGAIFSWTHTTDTRFSYYEVQYKNQNGQYSDVYQTVNNMYDFRPIEGGTYNFRVRARGLGVQSSWLEITGVTIYADPDAPPIIENLRVINGPNNYTFNGRDCEIAWDEIELVAEDSTTFTYIDSTGVIPVHAAERAQETVTKWKDYQIEVLTTADVHLRYAYTTDTNFIYTWGMNDLDNDGTPIRNIKFELKARDIYGNLSNVAAVIPTLGYATNPAPSMSGLTPTVTDVYNGLKVDWSAITPSDNDMLKYKVYLDTNNPPTTEVAEVSANTSIWFEYGLTGETTYRAQIEPYDLFGAGTKSDVVNGEPLLIAADSIEGELTDRLEWTDNSSRTTSQLSSLYDRDTSSGSITYNSGDWINVSFPMENTIDRIAIWANKTFRCYIGYKQQGDSAYSYLKAEADHTLDSDGRLVAASGQGDANNNYWNANAGVGNINVALFPQGLIAKEVAVFILTNSLVLYEIRVVDQVIAEAIIANELSAISANLGIVSAGIIQSPNPTDTDGMLINLNEGSEFVRLGGTTEPELEWDGATGDLNIRGVVTFKSGSTMAWSGITDDDGNKPENNATDNTEWEHPTDITKIDGGEIYAGSQISVAEGGKVIVGDNNVVLDGDSNSIIVAPDGGKIGNDYAELKDGNLVFYYWDGSQHVVYKSVKKVISGICNPADGRAYTLPGIWRTEPEILLAYDNIDVYQKNRESQTQTLVLDVGPLTRNGLTWNFHPKAQLVLGPGSVGTGGSGPYNQINTTTNDGGPVVPAMTPADHWLAQNVDVTPAQNSITVTGNTHSYMWATAYNADTNEYKCRRWTTTFRMLLYVNGVHVQSTGNIITSQSTGPYNWSLNYIGTINNWSVYFDYIEWTYDSGAGLGREVCTALALPGYSGRFTQSYISGTSGGIPGTTVLANGSLRYIAVGD